MTWGRTNSSDGAPRRARHALLAALSAIALSAIAVPAAQAGGPQLLPDLRTLPPSELYVQARPHLGTTFLRLSNEVGDHGTGPLELRPEAEGGEDCNSNGDASDDRWVDQVVYLDVNHNGRFNRKVDTATDVIPKVGCRYYHPAHDHYHFDDFALYQLRDPKTDALKATSKKKSFCLLDTDHAFPNAPGSAASYFYTGEFCYDINGVTGLSPGWADIYSAGLPGQSLNITALPAHRYCLVSKADPDNKLTETSDANNEHRTLIHLDPAKLKVTKVAGGSC